MDQKEDFQAAIKAQVDQMEYYARIHCRGNKNQFEHFCLEWIDKFAAEFRRSWDAGQRDRHYFNV